MYKIENLPRLLCLLAASTALACGEDSSGVEPSTAAAGVPTNPAAETPVAVAPPVGVPAAVETPAAAGTPQQPPVTDPPAATPQIPEPVNPTPPNPSPPVAPAEPAAPIATPAAPNAPPQTPEPTNPAAPLAPLPPSNNSSLPLHWHEVKSFGSSTQGGLGGEVCRVTSLSASGDGSFKDCASKSNTLVVFEVGGVIDLDGGGIGIGGDNVTVAGETAPSPGISVIKGNVSVTGNDVVLSHIAVQRGDAVRVSDGSNIRGENIIYNHVSVMWGTDETVSMHGVSNVTLYKSIIAESLQFAGHEDIEHSKGSLINKGSNQLALIGNLFTNNASRNPRVDTGEIFIANQVVHNWGPYWDEPAGDANKVHNEGELEGCTACFNKAIAIRAGCKATLLNSVGLRGPDTFDGQYLIAGHAGNGSLWEEGNMIVDQMGAPLTVVNPEEIDMLTEPAIWPEGFVPMPTEESFYEALRTAGPRPGDRDTHHARLVQQIAEEDTTKSEIIDSQDEVGGYPNYPATSRAIGDIPAGAAERQAWLDKYENDIAVDRTVNLSRLYGLVGSEASDKLR